MPLRVVYNCKTGCGYQTVITEDFSTISAGGWTAPEHICPRCGADQYAEEDEGAKRNFRSYGLSA